MSRRSYHAFVKAARKDGGLSLPAARKAYRKVSERLGAPAKAVDIKRHPRVFREALTKREREKLSTALADKRKEAAKRKRREVEREKEKPRKREIATLKDFLENEDWLLQEDIEYASTAEY